MSLTSQLITVKNIFYKGISGFIQCLDFLGKMSGFFPKNVWIYPDVVWIFSEKLWGPMQYTVSGQVVFGTNTIVRPTTE